MSSRKLALVLVFAGACDYESQPASAYATAITGEEIRLLGGAEEAYIKGKELVVEWVTVEAPEGSSQRLRVVGTDTLATFGREGRYILDRWIDYNATSTWTHRYAIDVGNAAPTAAIDAQTRGEVGVPFLLSASPSTDPGGDDLQYQWFLTYRPAGSAVALEAPQSEVTQFIPDAVGEYAIELDVFDGKLWAESPAVLAIYIQ